MISIRVADEKQIVGALECLSTLNFGQYEFVNEAKVLASLSEAQLFVALENPDEINEQVVGAMMMHYADDSYEILNLACRKGYSRQGIGSALVNAAIQRCQAERVPKLWCWSLARYNAKLFYEKLGFEESYYLCRQFCREDCWILGKVIEFPEFD